MPFASVVQESDVGTVCPAWETAPSGVVSLLQMLDFSAKDYVELAHRFGLLLGEGTQPSLKDPNVLGDSLTFLLINGPKLGLNVTVQHLIRMMADIAKESPQSVKSSPEGFQIVDGKLAWQRMAYHIEALYSTMLAEMSSILFKAIPRERVSYCDEKWLVSTPIAEKFPVSLKELQRAGACYALGEPTACVFHSMRAIEKGLHVLAKEVGSSFPDKPIEYKDWGTIIPNIESKITTLQKSTKTVKEIEDLKFFSEAAIQFMYFKDAWRNHVAHSRENYSDKEAFSILGHCQEFLSSLCPRLKE